MKNVFRVTLICTTAAFLWAGALPAQADASNEARDIIKLLTRRSSLPEVEGASKLDGVSPEVARALGERLVDLDTNRARRMTQLMRESANPHVHAALLLPLANADHQELASSCLKAILSMEYGRIVELRASLPAIHPTIATTLKDSGRWKEAVNTCLIDLMNEREHAYSRNADLVHRETALALLANVFLGEAGYALVLDQLLDLMVGQPADDEAEREAKEAREAEQAAADAAREKGEEDEDVEVKREVSADEALYKRKRALAAALRRRALTMFRRIFLYDPERFQFGTGSYELRKERRQGFAQRVQSEIYANDGPAEKDWLGHVNWVSRFGDEDERLRAMVLADELCGRIKIPIPEGERAEAMRKIEEAKRLAKEVVGEAEAKPDTPDPAAEENDIGTGLPDEVEIFAGSGEGDRINQFKSLDKRDSQRPRIRALRLAFDDFIKRVRGS